MKRNTENIRLQLENRMFDSFMSLNENKNIVLNDLDNLSKEQLIYILTQYSQFPRSIISILVNAAYNFGYHGWTKFVDELRDNVFQELGGDSGNIASEFGPHYSILRKELQNVFGIDISEGKPSAATISFLNSLKFFAESEPLKAAGSLFALEASAVPELGILMKLVSNLADRDGKILTKNLVKFFQFHMDVIEVGHRDRLIKLVEDQLTELSNFEEFLSGYDSVLRAMDIWWSELYSEAQNQQNEGSEPYKTPTNNLPLNFATESHPTGFQQR